MTDVDLRIKVASDPKNPFADIKSSLDDIDGSIKGVAGGFTKVAGALGGVAALAGAFNFITDATREMQDLQTQFITFTGSAEGAADQMARLTQFASKSPFALAEVAEANRTLLAFGSGAEQSVEQLRQIGEISAATGKDLSDLAGIFGKIQQTGKLTGETFQQLIERGVNLGPEIAKSMGVASSSITDLISKSKISADEVSKALATLTSEGGQYFGSTVRMSETLSGSISTLKDNVSILAAEIGQRLAPSMTQTTNIFSEMVGSVTDYLAREREIAASPTAQRIQQLGEQIEGTSKRFQNFLEISRMDDGIGKSLASFPFGGNEGVLSELDKLKNKLKELVAQRNELIDQSNAEAAAKAAESEIAAADKAWGDAEQKRLGKLQEARDKQNEIETKAAEERQKKIQDAEANITKLVEQETAVRFAKEDLLTEQSHQRKLEADKRAAEARLIAEQEAANGIQVIRSNADIADELRRAEAAEAQRVAQLEAVTQRETEITTARAEAEAIRQELLGQYAEAEVIREEEKNRRLTETQKKAEADRLANIRKAQKEQFNFELMTDKARLAWDEQTYAQRLSNAQAGMNALSGLMRSKNREAFEIGKAAATAQALVAIPTTAIEAYKSLAGIPLVGPALGAAAAAAAIVSGMEQVRAIQNTRLAMAEGGMVPGVGNKDTVPALLTPGEVVVPKQNYNDLQESFVRGSINDDQINLLQAGNALLAKIMDHLVFGAVMEKLTTIVSILDDIKENTVKTEQKTDVVAEINEIRRNSPNQVGPDGQSSKGDDRKAKRVERSPIRDL